MKKRFISLLLMVSILLSTFSAGTALAQDDQLYLEDLLTNSLASEDLIVGDTYGIYPQSWYLSDMNKPISHAQLRVLMAGLRHKILKTDCVIDYEEVKFKLHEKMTVKEVLEAFYLLISSYDFEGDIGIVDGGNAVNYMKTHGIYKSKIDLSLKDVCSIEQACVIATRLITYIYDALDAASKGFLWEINSGENTVYLLGSIHVANYDIYPFSKKMLKAFDESDVLYVEVDLLGGIDELPNLLEQYGLYTDGTTLKDHVSEETYEKTINIFSMLGMSEEEIIMYKPWVIQYILAPLAAINNVDMEDVENLTLDASLGVDLKFLLDAYLKGKPVEELESYELQIKLLDSFSDQLDEYLLVNTLDSLLGISQENEALEANMLNQMLEYWHTGDVEGFMEVIAPILVQSELPFDLNEEDNEVLALMEEYYDKLLTQRDKVMAEKIDRLLKEEGGKTYFIVVGAAHYISNYSILDILKEKGYEINQIK
ncbi:TraB/GumN family protein [Herbinix luporum]|jgi:uncharacterized protein YbaP (TraB family)|uniref:TraB/GumN family protein n=1 Tax=Herbinix luporum TaxID=1679721 RepID=UPI00177061CA|nr:TraB/GumN family protein [Herbinix luporum]HHT57071.1 TraB/GumN family protein [Herbinix luporum]